ncbi:hypothetical protein [Alicyclobacillus tolerans]|uniref:hypothetical protein n=1 Tax=Alicyclobacillus tolerans TaxID=90970 RepID=UPI000933C67C|nr:hypothetical protein [Alicyclobacillus montanus]
MSGFFASGLFQNFALSFFRPSPSGIKKKGRIQDFDPNSPVLYGTTIFTQGTTYFAGEELHFANTPPLVAPAPQKERANPGF